MYECHYFNIDFEYDRNIDKKSIIYIYIYIFGLGKIRNFKKAISFVFDLSNTFFHKIQSIRPAPPFFKYVFEKIY